MEVNSWFVGPNVSRSLRGVVMGAGHERRGGEQDGRSNAAVPGQGGGGRSYQSTTGVLQSGKSVRLLMKGGGG